MPSDLRVVTFRDMLQIQDAAPGNVDPPSILLTGKDFNSALRVLINGIECPEFVVLSSTRMLVQLPDSVRRSYQINTIEVISARITLSGNSYVDFSVGAPFGKSAGIEKLMQWFVKILLQRAGSDLYHPEAGGGLLDYVGSTTVMDASGGMAASISKAIDATYRFMQKSQMGMSLPPNEKILSAQLVGLDPVESGTSVAIKIRLISMAGEEATPTVQL